MGAFFVRLLTCERRLERYRLLVVELERTIAALQQQLRDERSQV